MPVNRTPSLKLDPGVLTDDEPLGIELQRVFDAVSRGLQDRENDANDVSSGALTLISSATASDSTVVDFTTGIDSTYDVYRLIISGLVPATDAVVIFLRISTDGGSTFKSGASDYRWAISRVSDAAGVADNSDSADSEIQLTGTLDVGNAAGEHFNSVIDIFSPSNSALFTHVSFRGSFNFPGANIISIRGAGSYQTAAAVNGLRILTSSGNVTSGKFDLYGIVT